MTPPYEKFARDLEAAGLVVQRKGSHQTGYIIRSRGGKILGSFGANIDRGRTKQNILAQIKRATGIVVSTEKRRH